MKFLYILLASVCLVSCEKTKLIIIDNTATPSATYYYYSYKASEVIDAKALGYAANEFMPDCTYALGDTLFISNTQNGKFGLELYSLKEHKKLKTLNKWSYNGSEQTFNGQIEAISVADGRLYLANRGSCIDVFDLKSLDFITRIGDRNWGTTNTRIFHAHAMAITGNYIIIRMKNSLQVTLKSEVTAAKYQKINYFARSSTAGFDVNNGFYAHQMTIDTTGKVLLADYGQAGNKKIQIIDTSLIKQGNNLTLTAEPMALDFNPRGIAVYKNMLYISAADGSIRCYDRDKKEFTKTLKAITGYTLKGSQKLFMTGNRLWVSDISNKAVVGIDIFQNAIEEFE